ncbi:hypothetical protein MASR2M8_03680 [Opitutaceae bacterium]
MKTTSGFLALLFAALVPVWSAAQIADASESEAAWFAGEWSVAPADVDDYETIASAEPTQVRIQHLGGARIERTSPARAGREAVTTVFTVKRLAGNFPWWADGRGSVVTRKVSDDSFDLASVGPMGRADWSQALRHTRVVPTSGEESGRASSLPPGFVQIFVNHVKADRQADFELWLHEYRLLVERMMGASELNEPEQRAYAAWRILAPDNETLALSANAGLPLQYLFIFDPVVEGVSYDLRHYLERALTPAEAEAKMAALQQLMAAPQSILSGVPL